MIAELILTEWQALCSGAYSLGLSKAGRCSDKAREMILAEVVKFTLQAVPVDADELKIRHLHDKALNSVKIEGISSGDSMARRHPRLSERIYDQVSRLCDLPLPASDEELIAQFQVSSEVTSRISEICYSDR
jgi:hypothetical protein